MTSSKASKPQTAKCPGCGRPTLHEYRPFCSKRCRMLDLSKWLNEDYRVPVVDGEGSDDSGLS